MKKTIADEFDEDVEDEVPVIVAEFMAGLVFFLSLLRFILFGDMFTY